MFGGSVVDRYREVLAEQGDIPDFKHPIQTAMAGERPKYQPESRSCPDCEQGKHRNCTGEAWDNDADDFAPCPCGDLIHGGRNRDARERANP
jgi:hypothetical protein